MASTPRACATHFPAAVRQGLLFVRPTALPHAHDAHAHTAAVAEAVADEARIPTIPELDTDEGWNCQVGGRARNTSFMAAACARHLLHLLHGWAFLHARMRTRTRVCMPYITA